MDLKQFIELVSAQYELTDVSLFNAETHFRELDEYSSLISLSLIAMIDDEFNIQIKGDDIRSCLTIDDLFKKINCLKG